MPLVDLRHRKEVKMKTVNAITVQETSEMLVAYKKAVRKVRQMVMSKGSKPYKEALTQGVLKAYKFAFLEKAHKYFKTGNLKLDKGCYIWDIAEGVTCKSLCKGCYAGKASRQYKDTASYRLANTVLSLMAIYSPVFKARMFMNIERQLQKARNPRIALRLHSAGDMFSYEYWILCNEIAETVAKYGIKTYTYSKYEYVKTSSYINVVESLIYIDGKPYINYGSDEYLRQVTDKLNANGIPFYECSYGSKTNEEKCLGTCFACLHYKHVLFRQH